MCIREGEQTKCLACAGMASAHEMFLQNRLYQLQIIYNTLIDFIIKTVLYNQLGCGALSNYI